MEAKSQKVQTDGKAALQLTRGTLQPTLLHPKRIPPFKAEVQSSQEPAATHMHALLGLG